VKTCHALSVSEHPAGFRIVRGGWSSGQNRYPGAVRRVFDEVLESVYFAKRLPQAPHHVFPQAVYSAMIPGSPGCKW
jgi:hypothetical protein